MLKRTIREQRERFFGKNIDDKIVVFQSDGWGSARLPNKQVFQSLLGKGIKLSFKENKGFRTVLDGFESPQELNQLLEILLKHKDAEGKNPVFTFNVTTGNPDFKKIEEHGFREYFSEPFYLTMEKERPGVLNLWRSGIENGLISPQFMGHDPVNKKRWLDGLVKNKLDLQIAFQYGVYNLSRTRFSSDYYSIAYEYLSGEEEQYLKDNITQGLNAFQDFFHKRPCSFVAPFYVTSSYFLKEIREQGVTVFQSNGTHLLPRKVRNGEMIYNRKRIVSGFDNHTNSIQLIRNCRFEPAFYPTENETGRCLAEVTQAFNHRRPAVICSSRSNYVGIFDEKIPGESLEQLDTLLEEIIRRWPDVKFYTTDQIVELYGLQEIPSSRSLASVY
ncbi:hypothetical protein [Lunatibacter salilacus]|uniref:hypothetical protein n=1 Tax=Lunatibacter salilacus TaxID=2483804 RepID=UPI00131E68A5|nr:hypothetical protein [Lunatibacter salilacus]